MPVNHSFGVSLVFHLSTKCNLECVYCNVDAGPSGLRPVLDPQILEKWLEAFASLRPSEIAIQLHGGEPLIVDPPVELFAAIAKNTLARFPGTKLMDLAVQSNGLGLDERRADSLARAGVRINLSIDGPASIHDRQRANAAGRGSHREAVQAHHRLRARGSNTAVIAVVTDPLDVIPALQFFLEDGFRGARMNPIRPEGRAALIREWDDGTFMREMAVEYLRAAKLIAAYNERFPHAPFIEDNLATLLEYLIDNGNEPTMVHWTFLIDDRGHLWAHPGSYGVDALHLTRGEIPNVDVLRRALALPTAENLSTTDVVTGLRQLRARLFTVCARCRTPNYCVPFCGPREDVEMTGPGCVWRSELLGYLEGWLRDDPEAARRIARPRDGRCLGAGERKNEARG
jgi:MoaA/NifB/PqqE/SkfB family radical SAM enzyme